jgi:hypothetical protein
MLRYYYALDYRSYTVLLTNVVAVSSMIASHLAVLTDASFTHSAVAPVPPPASSPLFL